MRMISWFCLRDALRQASVSEDGTLFGSLRPASLGIWHNCSWVRLFL